MGTEARGGQQQTGRYIFRSLLEDVPLFAEDSAFSSIEITCVELWGKPFDCKAIIKLNSV
jgi:hypothetical protein